MRKEQVGKSLRAYGALLAAPLAGVLWGMDIARIQVTIAVLSVISLVILAAFAIIGRGKDWGIIPVDLGEVLQGAVVEGRRGALYVWFSLLAFVAFLVGLCVYVIF